MREYTEEYGGDTGREGVPKKEKRGIKVSRGRGGKRERERALYCLPRDPNLRPLNPVVSVWSVYGESVSGETRVQRDFVPEIRRESQQDCEGPLL